MADLLIHSLSEFREVIDGALAILSPEHIVEVGSESGRTTELLAGWAASHHARLTTIDPAPVDRVRALTVEGVHRVLVARSPGALVGLAPAQLYLLDGDHNYWTVSHELAEIAATNAAAEVAPVVLAHDVGWPCARRDMYYDPSAIPPEHVHPHSFTIALHLDEPEPVALGGFGSAGNFAIALHAGGPANGVLTAIEDFLRAHGDWELHVVPAVFGLGVLFPRSHPRTVELHAMLARYVDNPLVARLEENRLRNWLEVRRLQDRDHALEQARVAAAEERARLAARVVALEAELADARRRVDEGTGALAARARRWLRGKP